MKFRLTTGFKKYFANTTWVVAERVISMGVALVVSVALARYLGPADFGTLNYVASFVALFTAFSMLGLETIVVRELIYAPLNRYEVLGTAFVMKLIGGTIAIVLIYVISRLTADDPDQTLMLLIVSAGFLMQATSVIEFHFQAEVTSKYTAYARLSQTVISAAAKLLGMVFGAEVLYFVFMLLLDATILAIGLLIFYAKQNAKAFPWKFQRSLAVSMLSASWPLFLSSILVSTYMRIDQVMIKEMLGVAEVGLYSAAVKISEAWYFIPLAISASLFPAIMQAKIQDAHLYYRRLQKFYWLLTWLALGIATPFALAAKPIVTLIFGLEFVESGTVLSIHIWSSIFVFWSLGSGKWLAAEQLHKFALYRAAMGVTINVVLNFVLIPGLGIQGAAVATLISLLCSAYLVDLATKKTRIAFYMKTRSIYSSNLPAQFSTPEN